MIKSFKTKEVKKIFNRKHSKKISHLVQRSAERKLTMLHKTVNLRDLMMPPSNHLESLSGKRSGQYSIRINKQWRICFNWKDGNAYNVEITDYH
jgi:toxin HigB-1